MPKEQSAMFEDSIGEIVDQYIRDGMSPDLIEKTLQYQASYVQARAVELLSEKRTQESDAPHEQV